MSKFFGVSLVVLAIVVAVLPQFTTCDYQGFSLKTDTGRLVPMKCLWTARAEIGIAVPLLAVGGIMVASRRRETKRTLGILGLALGAFALALPAGLIGVCTTMTANCNLIMRPAMLVGGSLAMAVSVAAIIVAQRSRDSEP